MSASQKPKKRKKQRKQHRILATIATIFLSLFLICIITGAIVGFTVFSDLGLLDNVYNHFTFLHKSSASDVAGVDYIDLNEFIQNQSQTTIIYAYDEDGNELEVARLHGTENRIWADLDEISPYLQNAYIALEDYRFKEHDGVDWVRTIGGVISSGFQEGGSSITQQLIKNLTGKKGRTFYRKYNEIKSALKVEQHFSKETILEAYLNTVYLDAGCYGVKTGAEYYFGKSPKDLTLMESCIIASITNAPYTFDPLKNYENNRTRALYCLRCMLEQEMITQEEYDEAKGQYIIFADGVTSNSLLGLPEPEETAAQSTELVYEAPETTTDEEVELVYVDEHNPEYQSYYIDLVIDMLIEDFMTSQNMTYDDAWAKVYYGGLKIYAAVDLDIQSQMEEVYYNRITFPDEVDTEEDPAIQSAMTIMDYSGRIVGIVGKLDQKIGNRTLNFAASSPQQPGSSIKPLSCYAPAIELNYATWSTYFPNYGIEIKDEENEDETVIWPKNYGGLTGSPDDMRNLADAIAPSLNTIPARLIQLMTPQTSYEFLKNRFHISTLKPADADYAPLAVGAMSNGVTTLDMAAAYASFGNGGKYYQPYCYYKVTNSSGTTVFFDNTNPAGEQILTSGTAYVMNKMLQEVVTAYNGTGKDYYITNGEERIVSYAKSGTTTDNFDKWYVCGTPYYVCATWVGFEYDKEIDTDYYGQYPASKVTKYVMDKIHYGLDAIDFEASDEAVRKTYCTVSGKLATQYCYDVDVGWYKSSNIPGYCDVCGGYAGYYDDEEEYEEEEEDDGRYTGFLQEYQNRYSNAANTPGIDEQDEAE